MKPNLQICSVKEETMTQTKCIENVFNKIIAENSLNLGKEIDIQAQEAFRTPNRHDQKRTSPCYYSYNAKSSEQRKNIRSYKREVPSYS
jgi:hypothetical protein